MWNEKMVEHEDNVKPWLSLLIHKIALKSKSLKYLEIFFFLIDRTWKFWILLSKFFCK